MKERNLCNVSGIGQIQISLIEAPEFGQMYTRVKTTDNSLSESIYDVMNNDPELLSQESVSKAAEFLNYSEVPVAITQPKNGYGNRRLAVCIEYTTQMPGLKSRWHHRLTGYTDGVGVIFRGGTPIIDERMQIELNSLMITAETPYQDQRGAVKVRRVIKSNYQFTSAQTLIHKADLHNIRLITPDAVAQKINLDTAVMNHDIYLGDTMMNNNQLTTIQRSYSSKTSYMRTLLTAYKHCVAASNTVDDAKLTKPKDFEGLDISDQHWGVVTKNIKENKTTLLDDPLFSLISTQFISEASTGYITWDLLIGLIGIRGKTIADVTTYYKSEIGTDEILHRSHNWNGNTLNHLIAHAVVNEIPAAMSSRGISVYAFEYNNMNTIDGRGSIITTAIDGIGISSMQHELITVLNTQILTEVIMPFTASDNVGLTISAKLKMAGMFEVKIAVDGGQPIELICPGFMDSLTNTNITNDTSDVDVLSSDIRAAMEGYTGYPAGDTNTPHDAYGSYDTPGRSNLINGDTF